MATPGDFGDVDLAALDAALETLGLAIGRAEESVTPRISVSQRRALLHLERAGKMNLNQLAGQLGAIPSSASRLCDRLIAAGLVHKGVADADRREVELTLSPAGRRLLRQLASHRQRQLAEVLATMTQRGRQRLIAGLSELHRSAVRCDVA